MQQRLQSPTVRLRNFNSFAKAGLLEQFLSKVLREVRGEDPQISVLDLGCGKGGDVKKLVNSGVTVYCGVDVSFSSLEVLVRRVQELQQKLAAAKHGSLGRVRGCPLVEVSLVHGDCWQQRLEPAWDFSARHGTARLDSMGKTWFHLVTSQMACHYAFQSQASVDVMLHNASSRLCRGGYFVGTVPNSSRIISLERARGVGNDPRSIGNRLFRIDFSKEEWKKVEAAPDLWHQDGALEVDSRAFGVMYTFHLADAVEACPEPLVHFPSFIALAKRHGLHLCLGPTPLTDFVDTNNMKAELGRLRRIYAFEGGMALDTDEAIQSPAHTLMVASLYCADLWKINVVAQHRRPAMWLVLSFYREHAALLVADQAAWQGQSVTAVCVPRQIPAFPDVKKFPTAMGSTAASMDVSGVQRFACGLEVTLSAARLISKKGEGTFSEVLKARLAPSECPATPDHNGMKNHFDSIDQVNNLREIQALRRLAGHPNIIKLHEADMWCNESHGNRLLTQNYSAGFSMQPSVNWRGCEAQASMHSRSIYTT
ncbi:Rnmt [Symbiodinium sp. CCMP2592]|nr:Rnmt [Symbiodinium sp. CCMP2592]